MSTAATTTAVAAYSAARAFSATAAASTTSSIPLGLYQHYKQQLYHVIGTVRHTEDESEFVLYRQCYASASNAGTQLWIRPIAMFTGEIEIEGKIVKRFTLVQRDDEVAK